jgi:hypothetical protein
MHQIKPTGPRQRGRAHATSDEAEKERCYFAVPSLPDRASREPVTTCGEKRSDSISLQARV